MKKTVKNIDIKILADGKKLLTKSIIDQDFLGQKTTFWAYLAQLLWIMAIAAFAYFLNPVCFLFLIPYPFMLIKDIKKDIKRKKLQYYLIERVCIDKKIAEHESQADEYQLWFYNKEQDWRVAIDVDKQRYEQSEINEAFYVVFAKGEKLPSLCYSKKEWQWQENDENKR